MIVGKIANSHNDEYYTPEYAITPLLKYLKPNSRIWCPFDKDESLFVKVFKENGFTVINSHIDYGMDFFDSYTKSGDYIISNPPYSKKEKVFERLFELRNPFAMLVGIVGLFDSSKKAKLFSDKEFEIMYLNPRVSYLDRDWKPVGSVPYQSVYICHNILPKQIVFETIDKRK